MQLTLPRGRVYALLTALFVPILFLVASPAHGISTSVVISQVQIAGVNVNDEFVELFNASSSPVNLAGWRLSRRSSSATASAQNLVASLSGTIAAKSYYLIANPSASSSAIADRAYSATSSGIAADNTVILYSDNSQTIVDKLGFGAAGDVETTAFATNPTAGQSIERKPCGLDSDNNSTDFVLLAASNPHNSQSPADTACIPTPTPTPTPVATIEPTSTPSPAPTPVPMTPTPSPSTSPVPTERPVPTSTPKPSHEGHETYFPKRICERSYGWHWFGRFHWWPPRIMCHWEFRHWRD